MRPSAARGAASGQIKASFSGVEAVLTDKVAPSLGQVAAAATAAAATVAPAVQRAASAAGASVATLGPAVERVAAAAAAAVATVAPAVQQVAAAAAVAANTTAAAAQPVERMAVAGRLLAEAAAYAGVSLSSMPGAIAEVTQGAGTWTTSTTALAGALTSTATAATTATAAVAGVAPAIGSATTAAAAAGATIAATATRAAADVGRITEAFPRVDAAADRAGRAIEQAIAPAVQRAATATTTRLDAAAVGVERAISGTLSPAFDRMATRAGAALARVAPAVAGVTAAANTASAAMAKVGDLGGQAAEHLSILFGQARDAARPLAAAVGSVSESLTGLRISAVGAADSAAAAFATAAEPLTAALAPALDRVATVAGPAFDRLRSGAAAAGSAAATAAGQVGRLAASAGPSLATAASEVASLAGRLSGSLVGALEHVGRAAVSAAAELGRLSAVAVLGTGSLGVVGGATAAIGGLYEAVTRAGDRFHEMGLAAERAGVSVEWLSRLSAVAGTAGVELETLSNGFRLLEQRASQASAGDEAGIKAFARLGISAQEAGALMADPQAMFERVRASIAGLATEADRVGAAKGLLGLGGNQLIPVLTMDPSHFDEVADRMQRFGGTVSQADAEMGRSLGELRGYFEAAMLGIERAAARPVLAYLQQHMAQVEPQLEAATRSMVGGLGQAWSWLAAKADELLPHVDGVAGSAGGAAALFERLKASLLPVGEAAGSLLVQFGKLTSTIGTDVAAAFTSLDPALKGVDGTVAKIVQGLADAIAKAEQLINYLPDKLAGGSQSELYAKNDASRATRDAVDTSDHGPAPFAPDRPLEKVQADVAQATQRLQAAQARLKEDQRWATGQVDVFSGEFTVDKRDAKVADEQPAARELNLARSAFNSANQVAAALRELQVARGTPGVDPADVTRTQAAYNEAVRRSESPTGGLDPRPLVPAPAAAALAAPLTPAPASPALTAAPTTRPAIVAPPAAAPSPAAPVPPPTVAQNVAALKPPKPPKASRSGKGTRPAPAVVPPSAPTTIAPQPAASPIAGGGAAAVPTVILPPAASPAIALSTISVREASPAVPAVTPAARPGEPPQAASPPSLQLVPPERPPPPTEPAAAAAPASGVEQIAALANAAAAAARSIDSLNGVVEGLTISIRGVNAVVDDVVSRAHEYRSGQQGYPELRRDGGRRQGGQGGGTTSYNVPVQMTVPFDPRETATQIAAKIVPYLRNAFAQQRQRIEGAAMARVAAEASGGSC